MSGNQSSLHLGSVGTGFTRRRALVGAAGLAAATVAAGCSPDGGTNGGGTGGGSQDTGAALEMPTRVPFDGVTPDVPGDDELQIPDGFYNYPAEPVTFVTEPLPEVAPVTYMTVGDPGPIPLAENGRYAATNEQLGTQIDFIFGGRGGEYRNRFQVTLASQDLPDLCMMQSVAQLPQLLDSLFTDLTPYLSGDNVTQYPGLASKPSSAWGVSSLNGKIWGIPMPRPSVANIMSVRTDEFEARGVPSWEVANGEEMLDMMVELTDRSQNKFAIGSDPSTWLLGILAQMHGAPNKWRVEGDKFIPQFATEEFAAAVDSLRAFWEAGVFHPNSISEASNNSQWFNGAVTAIYVQGFAGWSTLARRDNFPVDVIRPPGWDGGTYASHLTLPGYGDYIGIPKTDESRVEELLRIMDVMASPFGTKEFLVNFYGLEGDHYELDADNNPIATERGTDEYIAGFAYMGIPYSAQLYTPGRPDLTDVQADYLQWKQPNAVEDPSLGLYSETFSTDNTTASRDVYDAIHEMIQGRRPIGEWQAVVDDYMSAVGTKAGEEYAEAYQLANS